MHPQLAEERILPVVHREDGVRVGCQAIQLVWQVATQNDDVSLRQGAGPRLKLYNQPYNAAEENEEIQDVYPHQVASGSL